jgi:Mycothiol maleylpyruvate isomerase N-terminal domain
VTGDDVLAAAEQCRVLLTSVVGQDWSVPVPGLEFSVASVLAHAANAALWYSADMWSGREDNAAFDVKVLVDAPNKKILTSIEVGARVLACAVDAAPGDLRGFHPFGSPDPSGFAAMACDELLVHAADAAAALDRTFRGDERLAAEVLARLYPWHTVDGDPWETLLWANGRAELSGRPFQSSWRWHCEPLSEWDGLPPTAPRTRPDAGADGGSDAGSGS